MGTEVFSRPIDKILAAKIDGILASEKKFMSGWSGIEKHIFSRVRKYAQTMATSSGVLDFDEGNVEKVNELNAVVLDAINSSDYPEKVKEYLRDFNQIKKFNMEAHSTVNGLKEKDLEKLINPIQKQMVDQTVTGLTGSGIDTEFITPMREGIMKNIVSGATIGELETYLEGVILSNPARLGRLTNYAGQIARDTLNQYDGQINSRIASEFGLNAYRYVGSLIDDSRPQCIRWVGKEVILKADLEKELAWAYSNGTGMIPGTNEANFATYRGGYNCRHSAIPFKLTKSEMKELGLDKKEEVAAPVEVKKNEQEQPGWTQAQKDLNFTFGESPLTPDNLKGIGIPDQMFILSDDGRAEITESRSHYDPSAQKVVLGINGQRAKAAPSYTARVTVHEYAHRTHFNEGWITFKGINAMPDEHRKAFDESIRIFEKNHSTKRATKSSPGVLQGDIKKRFEFSTVLAKYRNAIPGANYYDVGEQVAAYLDTIEALSGGKYGCGHGKKYFTQGAGAYRPMEWFAHAAENYWLGNVVFQNEFPELYDQMVDYYKTHVVKKKLGKFKT